jgi:hypothetical protein
VWLDQRDGGQPLARTPVPAADGPLYLWFPPPAANARPTDPADPPALKMLGVGEPLATLKGLRGMDEAKPDPAARPRPGAEAGKGPLLVHQRAFLIPAAGLLAVLSPDGTKLHLHPLDLRALLDQSGRDYLLVCDRPPQHAPRGRKWAHAFDVWSKKGGVKVEAVDPPPGLTVDGTAVSWEVPGGLLDPRVTLELKVSDAGGGKLTYTLPLTVDPTATPLAPSANTPSPDSSSIRIPIPHRRRTRRRRWPRCRGRPS